MRVCVFTDKADFLTSYASARHFALTVYNRVAKYIRVNFIKFNYNDLFNNRLKINGCVKKYYSEMVALIQKYYKRLLVLVFSAM